METVEPVTKYTGDILGQCGLCSNLFPKPKIRTFLGLTVCRNCEWKMKKFLSGVDMERLFSWIEKNMEIHIEFFYEEFLERN